MGQVRVAVSAAPLSTCYCLMFGGKMAGATILQLDPDCLEYHGLRSHLEPASEIGVLAVSCPVIWKRV